jgi:hypothetical protein
MNRILTKIPVLWLVALIVLPCTAPFSTCDWRDLVGQDSRHSARPHGTVMDHAWPHAAALRPPAVRTRQTRCASPSPVRFIVPQLRPGFERFASHRGSGQAPSTLRLILRI